MKKPAKKATPAKTKTAKQEDKPQAPESQSVTYQLDKMSSTELKALLYDLQLEANMINANVKRRLDEITAAATQIANHLSAAIQRELTNEKETKGNTEGKDAKAA